MRRFRCIVEDNKEPEDINNLWLQEDSLKKYNNGQWIDLFGNSPNNRFHREFIYISQTYFSYLLDGSTLDLDITNFPPFTDVVELKVEGSGDFKEVTFVLNRNTEFTERLVYQSTYYNSIDSDKIYLIKVTIGNDGNTASVNFHYANELKSITRKDINDLFK